MTRRTAAWVLVGLLAVAGTFAVLPLGQQGAAMFAGDAAEYVSQALDTVEHVHRNGIASWPAHTARDHFTKPPLYVNTLAASMLLLGREQAALAAGLVGGVLTVVLGLVVYWFVSGLVNWRVGLAATAATLALPAVSLWFPAAYADAQRALLVLLAVGLLTVPIRRWSLIRFLLLGVVFGLGLLTSATMLLFLALPIAYWLVRPREGKPAFPARVALLAVACLVAAAVASTWYAAQGESALSYARPSPGFRVGPVPPDLLERAGPWLRLLATDAWGYALGLLVAISSLAWLSNLWYTDERGNDIPDQSFSDAVIMLVLGALPSLALAVWSRVPPNTRDPLPGVMLLAVAVLVVALNQVDRSRLRLVLWPACVIVICVQLAAGFAAQWPRAANALRARPQAPFIAILAPALNQVRPLSVEAATAVLDRAGGLLSQPDAPREWYVSGASDSLNVSRLAMLAKLDGLPVTFRWGSYFDWTEADRAAKLAEMLTRRCVVVLYEPAAPAGTELAVMNRHNAEARAFVTNSTNGFKALDQLTVTTDTYTLSFYRR
jgi:4-amino-4-deoxy-L-arabinose transferase-like glycosyltransferase